MRRTTLLSLLAALAFVPAGAAGAGTGHCVATAGAVAVCPPEVSTCSPGDVIDLWVVGTGTGTASCGDAYVSCRPLRGVCSPQQETTTAGTLQCSSTGNAVAYCSVVSPEN